MVWDKNGKWLAGFSMRIEITTGFIAELWGLREGLILCCNLNISSLVAELDTKVVVDIFLNSNYHNNVVLPILDDCRQLVHWFRQI